jgi:hypothetical protein
MRTLEIRKKSLKTWLHIDNIAGDFIISKFYFNSDINQFQIVEQGQSKRYIYDVLNITVYDDTGAGTPETFATITELSLRLEALKYPAFFNEGQSLIEAFTDLTDTPNSYIGEAGRIVKVKVGEDGLEFGDASGFNLQVYEEGETPIPNVNEIEVIGATVSNDGGGKVTLDVTGGGTTPTLPQVLAQGNRLIRELTTFSPYTLVLEDNTKFILSIDGQDIIVPKDIFNIGDEIIIQNNASFSFNVLADTNVLFYRSSIDDDDLISLEDGGVLILKYYGISGLNDLWYYRITKASNSGGAVDSVNGQTGVVVLDADDIAETATRFWLTTALKSNYDSAYTWVNTNGATVLSFITNIATTVRGTLLTGLNVVIGGTKVTSSNTFLEAIGLLQGQTNDILFTKFLREKKGWLIPSTMQTPNSLIDGQHSSSTSTLYTLSGNSSGSRAMVAFSSTAVAGTIAFIRRNDSYSFQNTIARVMRRISFSSNIADSRFFCGLTKNNQFSAPTNVSPSSLTNIIGVCKQATSQNLFFITNDASGTATLVDAGIDYPANNVTDYDYYFIIDQFASSYIVTIERVTVATGVTISTSQTFTTDIMDRTTGTIQMCTWITNNATSSIASYLDGGMVFDFENI